MSEDIYKVVQLKTADVRRITAIELTPPQSGTVVVGGNNGHGKTSLLDSIAMALGGFKKEYRDAIRRGADKSDITVDMGKIIVHRTIGPKGHTLSVTTAEGHSVPKPQEFLDNIIGEISFDPLAVTRMKPKERVELLVDFAGLRERLAELDVAYKEYFEERTLVNRQVKQADGELAGYADVMTVDDAVCDLQPLIDEREALHQRIAGNDRKRREAERATVDFQEAAAQEAAAKKRLDAAQAEYDTATQRTAQANRHASTLMDEAKLLVDPDTEDVDRRIRATQERNQNAGRVSAKNAAAQRLSELKSKSEQLTAQTKYVAEEKSRIVASAKMPIEGLSFDGEDIRFGHVPFNQLSGAESLRVSLAMAMAMNPTLRVMLIRDGSLLDDQSKAMITKAAEDEDYQVWLEMVGEPEDATVIIEDGTIKS